ncbi:unnamed protein product [Camellia sinensis]
MQKFQLPIKVGQQLPRCQLPFLIAFFFLTSHSSFQRSTPSRPLSPRTLPVQIYLPMQLLLIYLLLHSTHKSLLALEEFSHLALLFWTTMADLEHSTSDDASVDSRAEDPSQDSKLEFSEDEETLITRMYNLVGESGLSLPGESQEELQRKLKSIGIQDIPQVDEMPGKSLVWSQQEQENFGVLLAMFC